LSLEENDVASAQILADIGVALRAVGEEGRFFILYIKPSGFNDEDSEKPLRLLN
jgi:hypothetical protein